MGIKGLLTWLRDHGFGRPVSFSELTGKTVAVDGDTHGRKVTQMLNHGINVVVVNEGTKREVKCDRNLPVYLQNATCTEGQIPDTYLNEVINMRNANRWTYVGSQLDADIINLRYTLATEKKQIADTPAMVCDYDHVHDWVAANVNSAKYRMIKEGDAVDIFDWDYLADMETVAIRDETYVMLPLNASPEMRQVFMSQSYVPFIAYKRIAADLLNAVGVDLKPDVEYITRGQLKHTIDKVLMSEQRKAPFPKGALVAMKAQHDAEELCGKLYHLGIVDYVLSCDSDVIAMGAPMIDSGSMILYETPAILEQLDVTRLQFALICSMRKSDYGRSQGKSYEQLLEMSHSGELTQPPIEARFAFMFLMCALA